MSENGSLACLKRSKPPVTARIIPIRTRIPRIRRIRVEIASSNALEFMI